MLPASAACRHRSCAGTRWSRPAVRCGRAAQRRWDRCPAPRRAPRTRRGRPLAARAGSRRTPGGASPHPGRVSDHAPVAGPIARGIRAGPAAASAWPPAAPARRAAGPKGGSAWRCAARRFRRAVKTARRAGFPSRAAPAAAGHRRTRPDPAPAPARRRCRASPLPTARRRHARPRTAPAPDRRRAGAPSAATGARRQAMAECSTSERVPWAKSRDSKAGACGAVCHGAAIQRCGWRWCRSGTCAWLCSSRSWACGCVCGSRPSHAKSCVC